MMGPVRLNTAAFWALEYHLALPVAHLLDHLLGGVPLWHSSLQANRERVAPSPPLLTGSVNIVFKCDENAKKAQH